MNKLQSRKQLLVAESELNRVHLIQEWKAVKEEFGSITQRAKSITSIVSSVAALVAGVAAFRRSRRAQVQGRTSWLKTILSSARLLSEFWLAFRAAGKRRGETASSD